MMRDGEELIKTEDDRSKKMVHGLANCLYLTWSNAVGFHCIFLSSFHFVE